MPRWNQTCSDIPEPKQLLCLWFVSSAQIQTVTLLFKSKFKLLTKMSHFNYRLLPHSPLVNKAINYKNKTEKKQLIVGYLRLPTWKRLYFLGERTRGDIWTLFIILTCYICPPIVEVPRSVLFLWNKRYS